jgi:NAD-dependent dihydropyrimidine dehydrogenase PreA subunit
MKQRSTKFTNLIRPEWIKSLRTLVQAGFALFCLYAGYRFYLFYLWGTGQTSTYAPRPPSVEAFLPISALVGLKRLILSGGYDMIHPAGLTIFLAALSIGLLLRKGFCGWICPVGFSSNLIEKAAKKLKLLWQPPLWLDLPLLSLKYLLLFFFLYLIAWKMTLDQIESFQTSPYNLAVDAKMLLFFLKPSGLAASIMLFLVAVSFFIRNFWCRYLCPYGALLGLLALGSPFQVKRESTTCIDCKKCEKTCPASIRITAKNTVRTGECIGCTECVAVCPVEDCLTLSLPGRRKNSILILPAAVVGLYFLFYGVSLFSGHWYSEVPPEVMKKFYSIIAELPHP